MVSGQGISCTQDGKPYSVDEIEAVDRLYSSNEVGTDTHLMFFPIL